MAALFGYSISKKAAAQALKTGALGTIAGTVVFEGLGIGYPLTIPAKIAVADVFMKDWEMQCMSFTKVAGLREMRETRILVNSVSCFIRLRVIQ